MNAKIRGLHVYGGAIVVGFGLSLVYPPAGVVFGGAFAIWIGLYWVQ